MTIEIDTKEKFLPVLALHARLSVSFFGQYYACEILQRCDQERHGCTMDVPGKHTRKGYGKSPSLAAKSTINGHFPVANC